MSATQTFHVGDLLSWTTGALVSPDHMRGVSAVAEFLTDGPVWTHQLPRLFDPVKAEIQRQHPWIASITAPDFGEAADAEQRVREYVADVAARHGEHHELTRSAFFGAHRRDPITEAEEMFGADRVTAVVVEDPEVDR